jgi:hypothetical protein
MKSLIRRILKESEDGWDSFVNMDLTTLEVLQEILDDTGFVVSKATHQGVRYVVIHDKNRDETTTMSNLVPHEILSNDKQINNILDHTIKYLKWFVDLSLRNLGKNINVRAWDIEGEKKRMDSHKELIKILEKHII